MADPARVAEAAWPGVAIDRDELTGALAVREGVTGDDAVAEVALALACARKDPAALAAFERTYLEPVPAGLAHMKLDAALVAEVMQEVRTKLLVGDPPRILGYAGQGKLRGLCQVMASRAALTHLRGQKREAPVPDELGAGDDPALAYLKGHYRGAFKDAFARATADLDARDRNLLRLHHLDGVTLEQLAAMYNVHRATAVRWLADVRKRLLTGTRAHLRASLSVSAEELDSILGLIDSNLDASVRRLMT